jgi:hypothetical protein
MNFFLSLIILFSADVKASLPELFGASFTTSSIGNQSNLDANDPSNNYYAPSLLGFSENFNVVIQATRTMSDFKEINNIVVTNSTNSNSASTTGNAKLDYPNFTGGTFHTAIPVGGKRHLGTLGISIFAPIGGILESNSGDPFLPEYVMYKSRYQRTSTYFNFAKKWSDDFAFSLGAIVGFQTTVDTKTNFSLNGSNYGSWAKNQAKVDPSLGVIVSFTKSFHEAMTYFTYQQEMKSNLKAKVYGEITNPSLALVDAQLASLLFYDPHTFRLGASVHFEDFELFGGVEYMMWSGYQTPIVSVGKNGGVVAPSTNFERIKTRDTINPRVGTKVSLSERWSTSFGLGYRMTPIEGNFTGSGNSVDVDSYIGSLGLAYRMVIWSNDVHIGTSFQYHKLKDTRVTKSPNQEDGTAGDKIGAPGYDLGGEILAASVGVKFNY